MLESEFQSQVIDLAHLHGWKVAHFRKSGNAAGKWRTAVAGDGVGWPDLFLVHPVNRWRCAAELKAEKGKVSSDQNDWLDALELCGIPSFVWRPSDWNEIERALIEGPNSVT